MIFIPIGHKIFLDWTILKGNSKEKEDFARADLRLFLMSCNDRYYIPTSTCGGVISAEIPDLLPEGVYGVKAIWTKDGLREKRVMAIKADLFCISTEEDEIGNDCRISITSHTATYGYDGLDAYEIAVMRGKWHGSEAAWIAAYTATEGVKGDKGDKGEKGDQGIQGEPGKDGLQGATGLPGKDGKDGADGKDGLNGADGAAGADGKDGKDGKDGTMVEYIYCRTKAVTDKPNNPTPSGYATNEAYQKNDEYIAGLGSILVTNSDKHWTDDPSGINDTYTVEWVCIRKKKDGKWGAYSEPAIWAKKGDKGDAGVIEQNAIKGAVETALETTKAQIIADAESAVESATADLKAELEEAKDSLDAATDALNDIFGDDTDTSTLVENINTLSTLLGENGIQTKVAKIDGLETDVNGIKTTYYKTNSDGTTTNLAAIVNTVSDDLSAIKTDYWYSPGVSNISKVSQKVNSRDAVYNVAATFFKNGQPSNASLTVDGLNSSVTTNTSSINTLSGKVTAAETKLNALDGITSRVSALEGNTTQLSEIKQTVDAVSILVTNGKTDAQGNVTKVINTAAIVTSINDNNDSQVSIKADKINFDGASIFKSLQVLEREIGDYSGVGSDKGYLDVDNYSNFKITLPSTYDGTYILVQPTNYNDNSKRFNLAAHMFVLPYPSEKYMGKHIHIHIGKWAKDKCSQYYDNNGSSTTATPAEVSHNYYDIAFVCAGLEPMFGCENYSGSGTDYGTSKHGVVLRRGGNEVGKFENVEFCCMYVPFNEDGTVVYKPRWVPNEGQTFIDDIMATAKRLDGSIQPLSTNADLTQHVYQLETSAPIVPDSAEILKGLPKTLIGSLTSYMFNTWSTENYTDRMKVDLAAIEAFDYKMYLEYSARCYYNKNGINAGYLEGYNVATMLGSYPSKSQVKVTSASRNVSKGINSSGTLKQMTLREELQIDSSTFSSLAKGTSHTFDYCVIPTFIDAFSDYYSESFNYSNTEPVPNNVANKYGSIQIVSNANNAAINLVFDGARIAEAGKSSYDITALNSNSPTNAAVDSISDLTKIQSSELWNASGFTNNAQIGFYLYEGGTTSSVNNGTIVESKCGGKYNYGYYQTTMIRSLQEGDPHNSVRGYDASGFNNYGLIIEEVNSEVRSAGISSVGGRSLSNNAMKIGLATSTDANLSGAYYGSPYRYKITMGSVGVTVFRLKWIFGKHSLTKYIAIYFDGNQ